MTGATERVADQIRAAIESGEYPSGEPLVSSEALAEKYGVHRGTAQKAVRQLAAEGYLTLTRRHRPIVKERPRHLTVVRDRSVYCDEIGYFFDKNAQGWRAVQTPTRGVGTPPNHIADLLGVKRGTDVFLRERLMGSAESGEAQQIATSYIPMWLTVEIPAIAAADTGKGGIYYRFEDHFDAPLEWKETISARQASREEQKALRISATSPVLVVTREARIIRDDRVIVVEVNETRMAAAQFAVAYAVQRDVSAPWPRAEGGSQD